MTKVEFKKASRPLSEYATKARKGPVIVYKAGKPFAAVIPIRNADEETVALNTNRKFLKIRAVQKPCEKRGRPLG